MTGLSESAFGGEVVVEALARGEAELAEIVGKREAARLYRDADAVCADIAAATRIARLRISLLCLTPHLADGHAVYQGLVEEVAASQAPSRAALEEKLSAAVKSAMQGWS